MEGRQAVTRTQILHIRIFLSIVRESIIQRGLIDRGFLWGEVKSKKHLEAVHGRVDRHEMPGF